MKRWVYWGVLLVVLAGAGGLGLLGLRGSYGYSVESAFTSLPAGDERLEAWLKAQPGVVAGTVQVERDGDGGKVVKVNFVQVRDLLGRPAFPALDRACRELGYGGAREEFHDARER